MSRAQGFNPKHQTPTVYKTVVQALSKVRKTVLSQTKGFADDGDIFTVAKALYTGINTPVSMSCLGLLEAADYTSLAKMSVKPEDYATVDSFYVDYCAVSFLRKFALTVKGRDPREEKAKATFYQAEDHCRETNRRLEPINLGASAPPEGLYPILARAQQIIKDCLGNKPAPLKRWTFKFGPGATSNAKGDRVNIADKLIAFPECTRDALGKVSELREFSPAWYNLLKTIHPKCIYSERSVTDDYGTSVVVQGYVAPKLIRGNRFATVPKNALTHRGIGIEPGSNVVWQLALGSLIADRLQEKIGLCKEFQAQINKSKAKAASLGSGYCTIDLSAASDTISYELVRYLLPHRWYEALATFRSPETFIDGKWVELEKFSSMGNGYTFELETLIFYSLTRAVVDHLGLESEVHVFGDDIIVRKEVFSVLNDVFLFCGFTINKNKSFLEGEFFESCGGDFLRGIDVRPYFIKEAPANVLEWFSLVNGIRRMGLKASTTADLDPRFRRAWLTALSRLPHAVRQVQGPPASHDAWIHTSDRSFWASTVRSGIISNAALKVEPRKMPLARYCDKTIAVAALLAPIGTGFSLRGEPRRIGLIAGGLSIS